MGVKVAGLLVVFAYAVLGLVGFARWHRRRPRPDNQVDSRTQVSYWLPTLVVMELLGLSGAAGYWAVLAFVYPTLHGADESYFILGGGLGLALFLVLFVMFDALLVVRAHHVAQRREALGDSHALD